MLFSLSWLTKGEVAGNDLYGSIHIDPETDRSALWRLAAPGKPAAEAEAEKGEGEDVHDRWPPLWHKRLRV